MKRLFSKSQKVEDFSTWLGDTQKPTKKMTLIEECEKYDVSPYVDDVAETSSGVYASLRGVASEAELERRLIARKVLGMASRANTIAILAFLVSVAALIKSFL